MIKSKLKGFAAVAVACLAVTACGSDDNNEEGTDQNATYVQFYNASAGSTATALKVADKTYESARWREELSEHASLAVVARYHDNTPAVVQAQHNYYIGTLTCDAFLYDFFAALAKQYGITTVQLAEDLRLVRRGDLTFIFNYGATASTLNLPSTTQFVVGSNQINPFDVVIYR